MKDLDERIKAMQRDRRRLSQIKARLDKIAGEKLRLEEERGEIEQRWAEPQDGA